MMSFENDQRFAGEILTTLAPPIRLVFPDPPPIDYGEAATVGAIPGALFAGLGALAAEDATPRGRLRAALSAGLAPAAVTAAAHALAQQIKNYRERPEY